jgi:ESS family glutamate:Na+ symporter
MIVAGVAAIRINVLKNYWPVILILAVVGAFATYFYNQFVAKKLFREYAEEQFLVMYGMLTGTASTGIVLLRELDPDFQTPAADNLVYQNFPAMIFGFPMMLLAAVAPVRPLMTLLIMVGFFIVMNLILFRRQIFAKKH